MDNILKGIKKFIVEYILNKDDLLAISQAYMRSRGIHITDEEDQLTISVKKNPPEISEDSD